MLFNCVCNLIQMFSFVFAFTLHLLGMAGNLRSNRPTAGFFEKSDKEILVSSVDDSDLEFAEDSDETPAETLDRYMFIVCFFFIQTNRVFL